MVHTIRSNAWYSKQSHPIDSYTIRGLLQLTGLTYQPPKSDKMFDVYTFDKPPHPFSKLEFVVVNPSVYGQFRGEVGDIEYAQAKGAQQMLNNWLAGKAGAIANIDVGEPWEKIVKSKTVTFKGGVDEFLFNLTNTYGRGIQSATPQMTKGLTESGFCPINVDDGALVVYMPNKNQYYLQKSILPTLRNAVQGYMNSVLDKITVPPFSVEAYGAFIGQHKSKLLSPLVKEGYAVQRVGNELRMYKTMGEGKAVIVQYHLETGVIVVTSIGERQSGGIIGVDVHNFLGLTWSKQDSNQLFSQYVVGTGLNTSVPTYAFETPTPLSYIMAGVKQEGLIESYQASGNFGIALATENTVSALPPIIGYIFKMDGTTLKIFMIVSCICDTEKLFSYHLIQLDSAIAYFCGTCTHKVYIENI